MIFRFMGVEIIEAIDKKIEVLDKKLIRLKTERDGVTESYYEHMSWCNLPKIYRIACTNVITCETTKDETENLRRLLRPTETYELTKEEAWGIGL